MRLECSSCGRSLIEKIPRALLGRSCLACRKGKLLEPESLQHRTSTDHPDPFTSCKPPGQRPTRSLGLKGKAAYY